MQEELKVAVIQSNLVWENPVQNRIHLTEKVKRIQEVVDLIVLPEMFTSGFTMQKENVAETMDGETVKWMLKLANEKQAAITGSVVILENDNYYNRLLFVKPNGSIETYDKRHAFTLAGEDKVYTSGKDKLIVNFKGWRICPLICYDLRFPVWARNVENYDVLLYVANWPKPRIEAWDILLKARATENMSYCIGVNRVGLDAKNFEYPGHSAVYNVLGEKISMIEPNKEQTQVVILNKAHIEKHRRHLGFLKDKDVFSLIK